MPTPSIPIPHRHGTLDTPLSRAVFTSADKVAVVDGTHRFTYRQMADRVAGLRGGLLGLGLASGDRVAGLALNSFRHLEAWFAIPTANLIFNDLNFRLAPAELEFIVNDSGARILLADATHWPVALDLLDRCPALERLVWLDDGSAPDGALGWDALAAAAPLTADPPDLDADSVAGITYTGGTTGRPKGVMQTHGNLIANAKQLLWANPLFAHDRFLHLTPMFHSAGVANIYGLTLVGGTHIICPGFEPELVGRLIEEQSISVCVLVPTMVNMFLHHPGTAQRDLSSWRLCIYAASPMPVPLLRRAMDQLPCEWNQAYGMTEMCPHVSQLTPDDHRLGLSGDPVFEARLASAGQPCIGVDVRIERADGTIADLGEVGEIVVRGPNMMPGYWNRPEETARAFTDDGWYRTGDLASVDEAGYLFIVDRAKDMIVSGGENVYTTEVETAIMSHPAVLEVAVFGIPDERWVEAVHAEIALKAGHEATADDIIAHCRMLIGGYKVPRSVTLRSEPLPKSGAGKILKKDLRSPYWTDRDSSLT